MPSGLYDERLTDPVIDSLTSLASERVLGPDHVAIDQTPVQLSHNVEHETDTEVSRNVLAQPIDGVGNPGGVSIDYEAEAEVFRTAIAQLAGGAGDPAPVVGTSVLDHIISPDPTPERTNP